MRACRTQTLAIRPLRAMKDYRRAAGRFIIVSSFYWRRKETRRGALWRDDETANVDVPDGPPLAPRHQRRLRRPRRCRRLVLTDAGNRSSTRMRAHVTPPILFPPSSLIHAHVPPPSSAPNESSTLRDSISTYCYRVRRHRQRQRQQQQQPWRQHHQPVWSHQR